MAITPNTNFSVGQTFTSSQANRFPRGIMAYAESTTSAGITTTETVAFTVTFTAVANRYYKFSYHESILQVPSGVLAATEVRMRLTNVSGTQLHFSQAQNNSTNQYAPAYAASKILILPAGSTTVVLTLKTSTGTANAFRDSTAVGFFVVEDIGAA